MRLKVLSCFLFSFLAFSAQAQIRTPKYSNEFLAIGIGGRGLGMAGTQTAVVNDVTSGYWNPAGLASLENPYEASLMHAEYFAGIANFDYGGFATRIDSLSSLGISVIRFAVDDIPDTRFLYDANGRINYDRIRFFSAADYAFLFSYARRLRAIPRLQLGVNFKVVHRNVGDFANAWGFGLDAGAQYRLAGWQFGLMLHDITGTFNAWSHNSELVIDVYTQTGNQIPDNSVELTLPRATLGIGKSQRFWQNRVGVLATVDATFTFDGQRNVLVGSDITSIDPSVGLELNYEKIVFLRAGVGNVQLVKNFDGSTYRTYQPDFGVGVVLGKLQIDYALTDIGDQSESLYSHVFSLKLGFGKSQENE
ncbi:MAG: PorV/PorQ family protein [Tunicatimonas sp.]|uniref:putative type IX sorting system protein PorV2 n=1 Tax=Tunicatimonas sp. TaxID=1940096 RepID=UPI003C73138D